MKVLLILITSCIVLGALSMLTWILFHGSNLERKYNINNGQENVIVYFNKDLLNSFRSLFNSERVLLKIVKIEVVRSDETYIYLPAGRSIYSSDGDFVFNNVEFNDELADYLGVNAPAGPKSEAILTMKHANSSYFPTLYFFTSEDRSSRPYSKLSVSWP